MFRSSIRILARQSTHSSTKPLVRLTTAQFQPIITPNRTLFGKTKFGKKEEEKPPKEDDAFKEESEPVEPSTENETTTATTEKPSGQGPPSAEEASANDPKLETLENEIA